MTRLRFIWALCLAVLVGGPVWAEGPEDTVRWIYTSMLNPGAWESKGLAYLSAPTQRDQFLSRRLAGFYTANDTYGEDMAAACVDFGFSIPGNDFDANEIVRSLSLSTTGHGAAQSVTAQFTNFGQAAFVVYDFIVEDGFWKLDDIAGAGWRVSNIPCEPRSAAQDAGPGGNFCYKVGDSTLVLQVNADGSAWFDLSSWQGNMHHCGAQGPAQPIAGGWAYRDPAISPACQIEILVTQEQGLRLTDKDWACKATLCGQRAVIDGLNFPRANQIDCASMMRSQN